MARIDELLAQILSARYGRDVRQSIHDSIEEINEQVDGNITTVQAISDTAQGYATQASASVTAAQGYASDALEHATDASQYASDAQAAEDGAENYYNQARNIVASIGSALIPQGTTTFANLPSLANVEHDGYMWNVSDSFITTSDFVEGAGISVPMGSNVYKITINNVAKWDIMAGVAAEVFTGTTAEVNQAILDDRLNEDMMVNVTDDDAGDTLNGLMVEYDGTTSGSQATTVQSAIDEDKASIAQLNNDLTELGQYELLATTTSSSWTTPTITEDLNNFRYLYITLNRTSYASSATGIQVLESSTIPVGLFKKGDEWVCAYSDAYVSLVRIVYVNDNTIKLKIDNNDSGKSLKAEIYGIS